MRPSAGAHTLAQSRSRALGARLLTAVAAIVLAVLWRTVQADNGASILFVSSQSSAPYLHFIDEAEAAFRTGDPFTIRSRSLPASQLGGEFGDGRGETPDMVVALGTQAAEALQQWKPTVPVLYALIPKATYEALGQSGRLVCPNTRCTAVYIDQPLPRMFEVMAAAFGDRRQLGVLFGPTSVHERDTLLRLAANHGFSLRTALVKEQDQLLPALDDVLKQSDVLLSLPDPVVYNPRTAKSILLTTYRYRVPVMAYSRAYADAGAALSVYSTPRQIARQTAGIIKRFVQNANNELPPPQYPRHFKVHINPHVAESLGLNLEDRAGLRLIIREADDE